MMINETVIEGIKPPAPGSVPAEFKSNNDVSKKEVDYVMDLSKNSRPRNLFLSVGQ